MPTSTKPGSKTDVRFSSKAGSAVPKLESEKVNTFATGFAPWQLRSEKFRPPPEEPKHELYREEVPYETWEEHYDDDGQV